MSITYVVILKNYFKEHETIQQQQQQHKSKDEYNEYPSNWYFHLNEDGLYVPVSPEIQKKIEEADKAPPINVSYWTGDNLIQAPDTSRRFIMKKSEILRK